jgi:hypothetical protein
MPIAYSGFLYVIRGSVWVGQDAGRFEPMGDLARIARGRVSL